jgi:hypothetical protein
MVSLHAAIGELLRRENIVCGTTGSCNSYAAQAVAEVSESAVQ